MEQTKKRNKNNKSCHFYVLSYQSVVYSLCMYKHADYMLDNAQTDVTPAILSRVN